MLVVHIVVIITLRSYNSITYSTSIIATRVENEVANRVMERMQLIIKEDFTIASL